VDGYTKTRNHREALQKTQKKQPTENQRNTKTEIWAKRGLVFASGSPTGRFSTVRPLSYTTSEIPAIDNTSLLQRQFTFNCCQSAVLHAISCWSRSADNTKRCEQFWRRIHTPGGVAQGNNSERDGPQWVPGLTLNRSLSSLTSVQYKYSFD